MTTLTEGAKGGLEGFLGAGKGKRKSGGISGLVIGVFEGAITAWNESESLPPELEQQIQKIGKDIDDWSQKTGKVVDYLIETYGDE